MRSGCWGTIRAQQGDRLNKGENKSMFVHIADALRPAEGRRFHSFDLSPGMPCLYGSLRDAVTSHPRNGVTVPQHVLNPSDSNLRRTFVPGFRVASEVRRTWLHATSQSHHSTACPSLSQRGTMS